MDKIDRLGWTAGISFISYGIRIGVRVNEPDVLGRLSAYYPPEWRSVKSPIVDLLYSIKVGGPGKRPGTRNFNLLYIGAGRLARTMEITEVFERFESDLHFRVAEHAQRKIFVHAGVVGWKGKAILIPGRSFAGKTTLVAELVRAGATYYSDEYAVLDASGRVHPFPRRLNIREVNGQRKCAAEDLGGVTGTKPLTVSTVIVSKYKQGAKWRPRQLSRGQGALALLDNAVAVRRYPDTALGALSHTISTARILKGVRGEAQQVVDFILKEEGGWA
jgi:hypothetical protein